MFGKIKCSVVSTVDDVLFSSFDAVAQCIERDASFYVLHSRNWLLSYLISQACWVPR